VRAAAGARFDELELHVNVNAIELDSGTPEPGAPNRWLGSLDGIVEQLQALREQFGVSYFVGGVRLIDSLAPVVARLSGT
jgi:hypothetical protein